MSELKMLNKTIVYRRAVWLSETRIDDNLEFCLRKSLAKLKTVKDTEVVRGGGQVLSCIKRDLSKKYVLLHIASESPGAKQSIIAQANLDKTDEATMDTINAPVNHEFLGGDIFVMVKNNNLCICASNLPESSLKEYFLSLFSRLQLLTEDVDFYIFPVNNREKTEFLREHGVKSITLNAILYKASASALRNQNRARGLTGVLARHTKALVGREDDLTEDSLTIQVKLQINGRRKKGLSIGEQELSVVAKDLVKDFDEEDDYTIITSDGQKIGPKDIRMQRIVSLPVKGNSVECGSAWRELVSYYKFLLDNAATED